MDRRLSIVVRDEQEGCPVNWPEFVKACEEAMAARAVDPSNVTVRLEVDDSYYDGPVDDVYVQYYSDPEGQHLIMRNRT